MGENALTINAPVTFTITHPDKFDGDRRVTLRVYVGATLYRTELHADHYRAYREGNVLYGGNQVDEPPTGKIFVLSGRRFLGGSTCGMYTAPETFGTFTTKENAKAFQEAYRIGHPAMYSRTEFIIFEETLDPEFKE